MKTYEIYTGYYSMIVRADNIVLAAWRFFLIEKDEIISIKLAK